MNWEKKIKECFETESIFYTGHAKIEMENEEFGRILDYEVFEAVCNGEIIEKYLSDKPYPSILIFGKTSAKRPLHILCAYNKDENSVIIITVYHPDSDLWIDYRRRKRL